MGKMSDEPLARGGLLRAAAAPARLSDEDRVVVLIRAESLRFVENQAWNKQSRARG
jgi:hypothetical protein